MRLLFVLLLLLGPAGCAGSHGALPAENVITVEGRVSVRGAEPLSVVMLETDQRTLYVLALDADVRRDLQPTLPGTYRVTGQLYAADWGGRPFAHLRPQTMDRLR